MKHLAATLVAAMAGAPMDSHAKPRPSIHREAQAARQACAPYAGHIEAAEKVNKLRRHTLTALLYSESRCRPDAESKKGARGLGQHTRSGAAAVGRIQQDKGDPKPWFSYARTLDPVASIRAAADLLAFGLELCGGLAEAIRMYNTGRCGPPSTFARRVLRLADWLRAAEELRT